jgi:hypothetical protein
MKRMHTSGALASLPRGLLCGLLLPLGGQMIRYLRSLSLVLVMAVLAACWGDRGATGPETELPEDTTAITDEQRFASLEALESKLEDLSAANLSRDAFNHAVAEWLAARAEFEASGIDPSSSIWARFRDGRLLIIANNLDPEPDSVAAGNVLSAVPRSTAPFPQEAPAAAGTPQLPATAQARLIQTFDANSHFGRGGQEAIQEMAAALTEAGYTVRTGGNDASVEGLRSIAGDGFFYINTHGGKGESRLGVTLNVYALQTSTVANIVRDLYPGIRRDLDAGRVVYMTANTSRTLLGREIWDTRYAITHLFVAEYWSFAANSIAFINACESAHEADVPSAFVAAMHAKDVGAYLGWTRAVGDQIAWRAARYFTDRMLGANRYLPETVPQRPFELELVLRNMLNRGYLRHDANNSNLVLRRDSASDAGLLRPSIMRLAPDTTLGVADLIGTMMIHGQFGPDSLPGRRVIVRDRGQEVPLSILAWTPDSIRVRLNLRASDPGFSGDVVVTSHGRKSNPRRLLAYHGTMVYTLTALGSQTLRVEMDLLARYDPDLVRSAPGEEPRPQTAPLVSRANLPAPFAEARWAASGTGWDGYHDCAISWSGSGTISAGTDGVSYVYGGHLNPAARTLASTFDAGTVRQKGYTETWVCPDETFQERQSVWAYSSDFQGPEDGSIPMQADHTWHILGGTRTRAITEGTVTLRWSTISPVPAFDPRQAK